MPKAKRSLFFRSAPPARVIIPATWLVFAVVLLFSGLPGGYASSRRKSRTPDFAALLARHHTRSRAAPINTHIPVRPDPERILYNVRRERTLPGWPSPFLEAGSPQEYPDEHPLTSGFSQIPQLDSFQDAPIVTDQTLPGPPTPGYNPKEHFDCRSTWWGRPDNDVDAADISGTAALGQPCQSRRECRSPLLCVDNACTCPLIPGIVSFHAVGCRLDPTPAELSRSWCLRPLPSLPNLKQKRRLRVLHPRFLNDLVRLADFSTCAVVGSAAEITTGSVAYGDQIDAHTAVIRFNEAPTIGYERFVGSRTTVRVQNVDHCGYHESLDEILVHYTPKPTCSNASLDLNPDFYRYVENNFLWKVTGTEAALLGMPGPVRADPVRVPGPNGAVVEEVPKKMSGGFFGVALAAHICGRVDLYGFSESSAHYYDKKYVDKPGHTHKGFAERHNWSVERACLERVKEGLLPGMQSWL